MSINLDTNIEALFSKMQGFISTKTVVGEPVIQGGVIIVPLIDVSFGLGVGGCDNSKDKDSLAVSSGGLGGKISPSAVLVIVNGDVSLVNIKNQNSLNKLIDLAPSLISKLNLEKFFKKKKEEAASAEADETIEPDIEY